MLFCILFVRFWNNDEEFYKIGITINNKKIRQFHGTERIYNNEPISIVEMLLYEAWKEEQKFISNFKKYRYVPNIKFDGYTECFKKEIYDIMFKR